MYVCIYIYIYIYMCICIYGDKTRFRLGDEFKCMYIYRDIHIHTHTYMYMYIYIHLYMYIFICTYVPIHTYICNSTTLNPILKFYHPKLSTPQTHSRQQLDSTSEFNPHRNRSAGLFRAAVRHHGGGCS